MSFNVSGTSPKDTLTQNNLIRLDLVSCAPIHVPPLCKATIPHRIKIEAQHGFVLLLPTPGTFDKLQLLVSPVQVEDGEEINTHVFNMSNQVVKVRRGDIISRLVSIGYGLKQDTVTITGGHPYTFPDVESVSELQVGDNLNPTNNEESCGSPNSNDHYYLTEYGYREKFFCLCSKYRLMMHPEHGLLINRYIGRKP